MTRIWVIVEGGVVQQVEAEGAEVEVVVVDYDVDSMIDPEDLERTTKLPEGRAFVNSFNAGPNPDIGQAMQEAVGSYLGWGTIDKLGDASIDDLP